MSVSAARGWLHFAGWAAVGAGAVLSVLSILTIGIFVLPVTAALAGLLAWRGDGSMAGPGILSGLGLVPIYVGYLNRGGPGTVCTTTGTGGTCTQEMSPWPWIGAGLCLAIAGAWLGLMRRRSARSRRY